MPALGITAGPPAKGAVPAVPKENEAKMQLYGPESGIEPRCKI